MEPRRSRRLLGISVWLVELDRHFSDECFVRRGYGGLSGVLVPHALPGGALGSGGCVSDAGGLPECARHSSGGEAYADVADCDVGSAGGFYCDGISARALQSVSSVFSDREALSGSFRGWAGDCVVVLCGIRTTFNCD